MAENCLDQQGLSLRQDQDFLLRNVNWLHKPLAFPLTVSTTPGRVPSMADTIPGWLRSSDRRCTWFLVCLCLGVKGSGGTLGQHALLAVAPCFPAFPEERPLLHQRFPMRWLLWSFGCSMWQQASSVVTEVTRFLLVGPRPPTPALLLAFVCISRDVHLCGCVKILTRW